MTARRRRSRTLAAAAAILLWAVIMAPLLTWGLPTPQHDPLLFAGQPPWDARKYDIDAALAERQARHAGADTDLNPLARRDQPLNLTATHAGRAEILRRYRLYSRQPDEMITFQALQQMQPRHGDLDPKLYQYGGAYIYLVGAALGIGHAAGLLELTSDATFYLQNPAEFGRFYVASRLISLVFGALTLLAAYKLARRAAGSVAGGLAMLFVALSPVFFTAVLEAKPHLPSTCLLLWAALSAQDFAERGRWRDALRMGAQAGLAFGFVLTGLAAALLWPALLVSRRDRQGVVRLLAAAGVAVCAHGVTNPYVPINLLRGDPGLLSNVRNSTAMYEDQVEQALRGAVRVAELSLESVGAGLLVLGAAALLVLLVRDWRRTLLVAAPGLAVFVLCVLLAAGKPAEFARFLILPMALLAVAAAIVVGRPARWRGLRALVATILVLATAGTDRYMHSFRADASIENESRYQAACLLLAEMGPQAELAVIQEPAPYAVPPVDFAQRTVILLPPERPAGLDAAALPPWLVYTADSAAAHATAWWREHYTDAARFPAPHVAPSPIAWANKPVFVLRRAER